MTSMDFINKVFDLCDLRYNLAIKDAAKAAGYDVDKAEFTDGRFRYTLSTPILRHRDITTYAYGEKDGRRSFVVRRRKKVSVRMLEPGTIHDYFLSLDIRHLHRALYLAALDAVHKPIHRISFTEKR